MKLKSMKMSQAEREKRYKATEKPASVDVGEYPYGLTMHLDDDALDKLGLDTMPAVGTKVMVMAEAEVTGCSVSEYGTGKRKSMTLQLQQMAVEPKAEKSKSTEEILYK